MSKIKELKYENLYDNSSLKYLKFTDTSELSDNDGIIGQERASKAMDFGLNIDIRGYNIYVAGPTGTGKTSYAIKCVKEVAKKKKVPDDWCYIYNFDKPNMPLALNLPAGCGKVFQKDIDDFIKVLKTEITKAFDSEDYEKEKAEIIKEYQDKRSELLEELNIEAEKQGFKVKTTNAGIYFLPVVEGKTLSEQEYGELDDKVKHEISEKSSIVQLETIEVIRKIKNIEKEAELKVEEWENKIALFAVGMHINDLKVKYKAYPKILNYLERIQEDILKNLDEFREEEETEEQQLIPWSKKIEESPADKYKVNLIVDNSGLKGAPVIVDFNPTFHSLIGKFEYENEFGYMTTDFTMIRPGLIHQANGGYLILQAKDVLNNVQSWEALKRVLKTKQISIENMKEQMGLMPVSSMKPEPIPVNIKVILIGSDYLYHMLYEYDEDFRKLFKIKADFDYEMDKQRKNILSIAQFISGFCRREKVPHFEREAVAAVIDYSTWLVEDRTKLSTKFNDMVEILCEASTWAKIEKSEKVTRQHVKKAIVEKRYRSNKTDKKIIEMMKDGTIMIDTDGEVIGQVNGLTIIDLGDYYFGKPVRITATTYMGESGIVNIEREIEMSGTSHSKGILILSGYIGQKYAQDMPLALSATLCFEQLYNGVDGDSASSAELYAILSSLAEVPIKQSIAVTGSVNQWGEIQPIGGASCKIEGFFELCKERGLDGSHGVIIPYQNIKNLILSDEVLEAVKDGLFHIYPIKTVDEGIEILTGLKAGTKNKNGKYPQGTLNYKVYEKLRRFALTVAGFGKE